MIHPRSKLVTLTFLGACAFWTAPTGAATAPPLAAVPEPRIEGLETVVARQLEEGRRQFEEALAAAPAGSPQAARAYGELAHLYHAYHFEEAASAAYANAEKLDPSDWRWPYAAGVLARHQGELDAAIAAFERGLRFLPDSFLIHYRLGEALLAANRLDEAEGHLRKALELEPESPAVMAALGDLALSRGEHERAVELVEQALAVVPEATRLHYTLGLAYRGLGDLDKAAEHLGSRGGVGVKVSDPLEDELEELASGERIHLLEGRRAFDAGRYEDAAAAFQKAVEADPRSARARINLATALGQQGAVPEALAQLEQAIALQPDNPTARFNLAVLLERQGRTEEAVTQWRQVVELAPEDAQARRREAVLLVDLGRYAEAVRRLEEAHGAMPQEGQLAAALARLLAASPRLELRDGTRALDLATRVYQAQPTLEHAETVAMALAELGRCQEAADLQRRMVEEARQVNRDTGSLEGALSEYEQGITTGSCRPPGGSRG